MSNRSKPNRPQIAEMAALYHCTVIETFIGPTYVRYNGKREKIGEWYECKEWTRDEWRNIFERISNTKTAELWQKAREVRG
jgi:hypothetical protein